MNPELSIYFPDLTDPVVPAQLVHGSQGYGDQDARAMSQHLEDADDESWCNGGAEISWDFVDFLLESWEFSRRCS